MPTFVSASTNGNDGDTVVVNAPADIAAGNLLLAFWNNAGNNGIDWSTDPVLPAGWTLYTSFADDALDANCAWFSKTATSSEPSTYTFQVPGDDYNAVTIVQYSNAELDTGVGTNFDDSGSGSEWSSGEFTAGSADDTIIIGLGNYDGYPMGTPSGVALRSTGTSGSIGVFVYDVVVDSTSIPSYTGTNPDSDEWTSIAIALKGGAVPGAGTLSASFSGSLSGTVVVPGAGTFASSFSGSVAGTVKIPAAGEFVATFSGSATPEIPPPVADVEVVAVAYQRSVDAEEYTRSVRAQGYTRGIAAT